MKTARGGKTKPRGIPSHRAYAHFAFLAWKTTGEPRFKSAGEQILTHIERNFNEAEGMWLPFDSAALRNDAVTQMLRPILRFGMLHLPLRGRIVARFSDHLAPFAVIDSYPQYAVSLMDSECLLDTLDGSCDFPRLKEQTRAAISWVETHCQGPFPGSLVESRAMNGRSGVYPIPIINDTTMAALWPTSSLLVAYCGTARSGARRRNFSGYRSSVRRAGADWRSVAGVSPMRGGIRNTGPEAASRKLQNELG